MPLTNLRAWRVELVIVAALLMSSGVWATRFWNQWTAHGGQPVFYQSYFEPAVMIACGRGFYISDPRPKPLEDFLLQRRDTFDCRDLPSDMSLGRKYLYQGAWFYLETAVGWTWRILGISWSGMGPLFGLLFGATIAIAYAIFRLGMGRLLAALCAAGLTVSSTHLLNLPHLRDYAKAPFTLALVFLIGWLVSRPLNRRALLLLAASYGAVLGVGYGFRTDFLVDLPVLPIVLFAFLPGRVTKQLALKAAATVLSIVVFVVVSWPALTSVYDRGGCQWHVALLGLQKPFDADLHIAPAPYDFGYAYSDVYIDWTIGGYARRVHPGSAPLTFCSHQYDVESGGYLREIASSFPADLIARAYGSVLQIIELPFEAWTPPMPGWFDTVYRLRMNVLRPKIGWGIALVGAAVLIAGGVSVRLGLFFLFFIAYFGGYPAIQFQPRHHFHLEFMTWWAGGFLVHQLTAAAWRIRRGLPDWRPIARGAVQSAAFACLAAALIVGALWAARRYQRHTIAPLFTAYVTAPKSPLAVPDGALHGVAADEWPRFLEVDLNEAACGPRPSVTFRYTIPPGFGDLSRTFTVDRRATVPGLTRIFLPVFAPFQRVEIADDRPGCFAGAYTLADLQRFPILLGLMLQPDWQAMPMYQRLADWESR